MVSISKFLPSPQSSYTWFLYLGIIFFITHLFFYGFGLNLSYFGLVLIYIGLSKPALSTWFRNFLWFLVLLDIYANINLFRQKINNKFVPFDQNIKEGVISTDPTAAPTTTPAPTTTRPAPTTTRPAPTTKAPKKSHNSKTDNFVRRIRRFFSMR